MWTLLRSISAQTAEGASAPASNLFVDVDSGKRVELSFGTITFGGSVAASAAKLNLWRSSGGRIDKLAEMQLVSGVIPISPAIETNADALWVTVDSFTGGTSPNISVDIYARATG